jgi:hypothetical protein
MNYAYEIGYRTTIKNNMTESNAYWISEIPDHTDSELKKSFFSIEQIKNNQSLIMEFHDYEYKESYMRTQKWTLENHPELLL